MQIEDILDDLPTTPKGRIDLIASLLETIDHWNAGIDQHRADPEPDLATIDQFTNRRNSYVGQLALLLRPFGVEVRPAQPDHDAEREGFLYASGVLAGRFYGDDEPEYTDADIKEHNPNYRPGNPTT